MARGMDVPDVNVVVQVGISAPEEYIQRVGRSGRAGREGRGVLVAAEEEAQRLSSAIRAMFPTVRFERRDVEVRDTRKEVRIGSSDRAFKATLGAYKTHVRLLRWSMRDAVTSLKRVFEGAGQRVPSITARMASQLGLKSGDGVDIGTDVGRGRHHGRRRAPARTLRRARRGGAYDGTADPTRSWTLAASALVVSLACSVLTS